MPIAIQECFFLAGAEVRSNTSVSKMVEALLPDELAPVI